MLNDKYSPWSEKVLKSSGGAVPELTRAIGRLNNEVPEIRGALKSPARLQSIRDIILESIGIAVYRSRPSLEQAIAQVNASGLHVTSKAVPASAMRSPGSSSVSRPDGSYRKVPSGTHRAMLLIAYLNEPTGLTDDQAAEKAGVPATSCYWKRCGELRTAGYIEPMTAGDGEEVVRVAGKNGILRTVCAITDEGRSVAYQLES